LGNGINRITTLLKFLSDSVARVTFILAENVFKDSIFKHKKRASSETLFLYKAFD